MTMTMANKYGSGGELIFDHSTGQITLTEIVEALDDLKLLMDFINDSSLGEEYKEYKTFRKLCK